MQSMNICDFNPSKLVKGVVTDPRTPRDGSTRTSGAAYKEILVRVQFPGGSTGLCLVNCNVGEVTFNKGLFIPKTADTEGGGIPKRTVGMELSGPGGEALQKFFTDIRDWACAALLVQENIMKLPPAQRPRCKSFDTLDVLMARAFSQHADDGGAPSGVPVKYMKSREWDGENRTRFFFPSADGPRPVPATALFDKTFIGYPTIWFKRVFIGSIISAQVFLDSVMITSMTQNPTVPVAQDTMMRDWLASNPDRARELDKAAADVLSSAAAASGAGGAAEAAAASAGGEAAAAAAQPHLLPAWIADATATSPAPAAAAAPAVAAGASAAAAAAAAAPDASEDHHLGSSKDAATTDAAEDQQQEPASQSAGAAAAADAAAPSPAPATTNVRRIRRVIPAAVTVKRPGE